MAWLKKGRTFVSDVTRNCYKVTSDRVAQGGFGEVYRGIQLDDHRDSVREVAIKVSLDPLLWHGEAYFGRLLAGQQHVVRLHDAFPLVHGSGQAKQVKYLLVFDWMNDGTVEDVLKRGDPWPETVVANQIKRLLRVLTLLHRRGICHADITPRNVFVDGRRLLLGDLGIAKQSLADGPTRIDYRAPSIFIPPDSYLSYWAPTDDVYQVGLIALSLLAGEVITSQERYWQALKSARASDAMKGWIRDALQDRYDRFRDSEEALNCLVDKPVKPTRSPRTLFGERVVFTGTLTIKRDVAKAQAKRAGATIQEEVNGQTTLVVAGQPNPLMIGQRRGTKLFDAHRLIRRGQRIAIIDGKRFQMLLASSCR